MSNFCTYCSAEFGTIISYKGKIRVLRKEREHFVAKAQGGLDKKENYTDSCQICNSVKKDRYFENGIEASNYILDILLSPDWRIVSLPKPRSAEPRQNPPRAAASRLLGHPAKPRGEFRDHNGLPPQVRRKVCVLCLKEAKENGFCGKRHANKAKEIMNIMAQLEFYKTNIPR